MPIRVPDSLPAPFRSVDLLPGPLAMAGAVKKLIFYGLSFALGIPAVYLLKQTSPELFSSNKQPEQPASAPPICPPERLSVIAVSAPLQKGGKKDPVYVLVPAAQLGLAKGETITEVRWNPQIFDKYIENAYSSGSDFKIELKNANALLATPRPLNFTVITDQRWLDVQVQVDQPEDGAPVAVEKSPAKGKAPASPVASARRPAASKPASKPSNKAPDGSKEKVAEKPLEL